MAASNSHPPKTPADQAAGPSEKPRFYTETHMQDRVRPLYDPVEVARKYLDEMEATGRLHNQRHRK
jgi:hypothetical protein